MDNTETKKEELIVGDAFDEALSMGADVKNNKLSLCKSRNKDNYSRYYELMLATNDEMQSILNKKTKDRSSDETNRLKEFKKNISSQYKQICDILFDMEEVDEDDDAESKVSKMVRNIATAVKMMDYIGHSEIDDEFSKYGITLNYEKMDKDDTFAQEHIKDEVKCIFDNGKNIKHETKESVSEIKERIFEINVPSELRFDKETNPTGIKDTDFMKMVELKAKVLNATDDESKENAEKKANDMVSDHVFQIRRNQLIDRKLVEFATITQS